MGFAPVTDHLAAGLALLTQMVPRAVLAGGGPATRPSTVVGVLAPWLGQIQAAEDALVDVLLLTIDTASGDALAQYGALLGVADTDDARLRKLVRAAALAVRSSGSGGELLAILGVFADLADVALAELYPAALLATLATFPGAGLPPRIGALLQRAVAGGVGLQLVSPVDASPVFRLASGEDLETGAASGFGNSAQTTGGHLAGVYG